MTDYSFDGGETALPARNLASMANWAGAAVSLALIVGIGVWGYKLIARDVSGVPVVQAMEGPMRVAPEEPGGTLAHHQGLAVNTVAGTGTAAPPPDRLMLAPVPAGLTEEDVALGILVPQPEARPVAAALPAQALALALDGPDIAEDAGPVEGPVETGRVLSETEEDDPMRALVEQLIADASPLTELDPGEDAEVVTELAEAEPVPQSLSDASGLARSLRPKQRPQELRVATLGSVAEAVALAAPGPAEPAVAEIAPDSLEAGERLVQIGAFDSPETARAEWDRLTGRFGEYLEGKSRVIQRASSGGRVFFRLRAHGFDDLSDARRFCATFVAGGVDCIPVVAR